MAEESIEKALSVLEAERENLSLEHRERLAELSKTGEETREGVMGILGTREKREVSPEQADNLLSTLKIRFEAPENDKLRETVDFAEVEKSLRAAPEKLYALHKLEETGGEPQVIGLDGDELVFEDRSKESPASRRDMDFNQSLAQAKKFGTSMQSPDAYKAMQKAGEYDLDSGSWLETDPEYREGTGRAKFGERYKGVVSINEDSPNSHNPDYGWRASLKVRKA